MIGPYQMVIINSIGSLIVFGGAIFYRYVFPKKKVNLFVLLLIISILPIISIFRTGAYESGDFTIHVRRSMEFYNLLSQGNLIPSWAGDLNATYGYPLFAFDYILPYYIISFFHFLGFSFISSLKIFLASNFILSGALMYLFSANFFKNRLAAFSASVFYLFAPYHLITLHFKVTIGEILAYTLIPLTFYFANKYFLKKHFLDLILAGFSLGMIVLSHIFVAVFIIPVLMFYLLSMTKNFKQTIGYSSCVVIVSLLVSAFQWAAPLIYRPYLYTTLHPPSLIPYSPTISDLLYSPWRLGFLFQGPKGELSFLIGYAQLVVLIILCLLLVRNKLESKLKKMAIGWIVLFFITIFLITPYSRFVWNYLPLLNQAGSHRLLIIVTLFTSIFAGYLTIIFAKKKWLIYGLILLAIFTTILNWGQRRVIPTITDANLRSNLSLGTQWGDTHFYAIPKWTNSINPWVVKIPPSHIEIVDGNGSIKEISRTSTSHIYKINALTQIEVRENTWYFPGWTTSYDNKALNIKPDNKDVMTVSLPMGNYTLNVSYADLPLFSFTKLISILTIIMIACYSLIVILRKTIKRISKA